MKHVALGAQRSMYLILSDMESFADPVLDLNIGSA